MLAEIGGVEKMISAKQKAPARSSPSTVSIYKVAGWLGDAMQIVDRS
jgi:hypothetical protein